MLKGVRLEDIHLKQESVDRMIDEKQFFQLVEKDEFPKEGNCNVCGRCGPRDQVCGHCYDYYMPRGKFTHIYGKVLNEEKTLKYTCRIQFRATIMERGYRYKGNDPSLRKTWDLYAIPEFIALCYYDRMDEECIGRVANPKTRLEFMDGFPTITHQHMDRESINRKNDEFAAEQLEKYFKANPKHRK